ncbi:MAG: HAMP domain-containing sensor histidine kinase [Myxococcota bacterium]
MAWFADRPGRSPGDKLRAARIAALCTLTVALAPLFGAALALSGFVGVGVAAFALLETFTLPLVLLRRGGGIELAGHLACALGAVTTLAVAGSTTGPLGPSVMPLLLLPVAATMFVGSRAGWGWLAVVAVALAGFACVDLRPWSARVVALDPQVRALATSSVLLSVGAILQGSIASMVQLEERRRQQLDAAVDQLEHKVDERTLALRHEVEERRRAEEDALRSTRAKSRFLANMSHELRTPLNAILGYTDLVEEALEDRADVRADLGRVRNAAGHLLRLIEDVLDLARVEQGGVELRLAEVEVRRAVVTAGEGVSPQLHERGNHLHTDPVDAGLVAWADPDRVRQILLNLLSNANKFTDGGEIRLSARGVDTGVELGVTDSGAGIAEVDRERIFERFVQADDSSTRRAGGAGLGLSISRELARRMGGDLVVSSEVGVGSTFTLRLPARPPGDHGTGVAGLTRSPTGV